MAEIGSFFGEYGLAEANPWLMDEKWDSTRQRGMISIGHQDVEKLKAALALIESVQNQRVIVRSLGVSGILRKAEAQYFH